MRFQFSIGAERAPRPRPESDADLEQLVGELVRRELAKLALESPALPRVPERTDVLAVVQWLAPFLQQTVLEAVRLGLAARDDARAGVTSRLPELPSADAVGPGPADLDPVQRIAATSSEQQEEPWSAEEVASPAATAEETRLQDEGQASAEPTTAGTTGSPDVSEARDATHLASLQVMLVASPLAGFAPVQRFLRELGHVPRVRDVQTQRFTGGRLYVLLSTEHPDASALAAVLQTELATYRPKVQSVLSDLIEVRLTKADD